MVQTNKILTVSYGTFSCTLEGFDDSFNTMKAIAEYFRDLAADDRYFGAEPPQPDAEMLARIAQKEVARQVEAHQDNNGILLRATAPVLQPAEPPAPSQPEPAAPAPEERVAEALPEQAPVHAPAPEPAQAAPAPTVAEPVAAEAPDVQEPESTAPTSEDTAEPEAIADTPNAVEVLEPAAPSGPAVLATEESMADKLARIRAVVERSDTVLEEQIEDAVEAVVPDYSEIEEEALPLVDAAFAPDVQDYDDGDSDTEEAEDFIGSVLAATETPDPVPAADPVLKTDEFEYVDLDTADEGDQADEDESLFRDLAEADDGEIADVAEDMPEDDLDDESENLLADAESQPLARAIKVKRAEIEQAMTEAGHFEETARAQKSEPAIMPSSLSADDEADLQAELDAVAAELAEAQAALNPPDELDDQTVVPSRAREGRADVIKGSVPPVTRLLKETEGRMDEPESAMSREAYDHLRAAVVATRAEASATQGEDAPKAITDAAYRDDLANVVRPRRPEGGSAAPRSRRPDEARPAPLKLVAEQRIDADSILPQRGPIRPRRVAAEAEDGADNAENTQSGFATFAREVGAKELPELLEAAAAYMSFVEGWEQFSRPQLMTRVKQVENSGFNREDGLRTFGQLLREGKIEKTSGGRFTASERIGFRPARKAAG